MVHAPLKRFPCISGRPSVAALAGLPVHAGCIAGAVPHGVRLQRGPCVRSAQACALSVTMPGVVLIVVGKLSNPWVANVFFRCRVAWRGVAWRGVHISTTTDVGWGPSHPFRRRRYPVQQRSVLRGPACSAQRHCTRP